MNPLSDFFDAIKSDPRIGVTHIGVYAALLEYWTRRGCPNPIRVFSYEIMEIAKISTSTTYHKLIRGLSNYGYIRYEPSYKKTKGSNIYIISKKNSF